MFLWLVPLRNNDEIHSECQKLEENCLQGLEETVTAKQQYLGHQTRLEGRPSSLLLHSNLLLWPSIWNTENINQ